MDNRQWTQSRLACVAGLRAIPVRGALPADDPRTVATLHAVRQNLSRDFYVYRFRPGQRDLGTVEGAFLLCGFMMALAEHHHGNPVRAIRYFQQGANVVLLAWRETGLAVAARDVEQTGGRALPVPCDVADHAAIDAAARQAEDHFGPIGTWINVAFTLVFAPFAGIKPDGRASIASTAGHGGRALPSFPLRVGRTDGRCRVGPRSRPSPAPLGREAHRETS